jgi:hypothetical protein
LLAVEDEQAEGAILADRQTQVAAAGVDLRATDLERADRVEGGPPVLAEPRVVAASEWSVKMNTVDALRSGSGPPDAFWTCGAQTNVTAARAAATR